MGAKQAFKLFKIRVAAAGVRKRLLVFPCRKELLDAIPVSKERFPLWFRLDRCGRSRSIAVNPQFGKTWGAISLIQHPSDFVLVCSLWLAPIRHNERRRQ